MNFTTAMQEELALIGNNGFKLGEYIYMGMGKLNGRTVCISVAYKIDYCVKKARQFAGEDPNIVFDHVNKVKIGQLEPCQRFSLP